MLVQIRQRLEQEKGKRQQVQADHLEAVNRLAGYNRLLLLIEQAQLIIQSVAQDTQKQLTYYINDMVSAAIEAVFPGDGYLFFLEFVPRRGRTEADLFLANAQGKRIDPGDADGGGLVNVVAFALRIALWSLMKPSRPTFILDEPFHFLHSREAHAKVAELLKTVSQPTKANPQGLQIIMITGEDESEEIIAGADKVIRVSKLRGVSRIS
jgi:hypothetical protein